MLNKPQDQNVGDGAVAIQAAGSADGVTVNQTNHYGVTVEQVRAVAQDTFRADFFKFLDHAGDVATARAQSVLDKYLERIQKENPAALEQANDPNFRYALLTAQKAQAISGDQNLETLLVELLVRRSGEQRKSLQQIVLNEALDVVSRLTDEQVAALTISFVLRRTTNQKVLDVHSFLQMMDLRVLPFIGGAKLSNAAYSHLAYTGCGVVELGEISLADVFLKGYPNIWQAGFPPTDPVVAGLSVQGRQLLRPSPHTHELIEVLDAPQGMGTAIDDFFNLDLQQRELVNQLRGRPRLPLEKVKEFSMRLRPYMPELFDLWDNTSMKNFMPSSVGIAIAHANLCRVQPDFGPLSIWIQ